MSLTARKGKAVRNDGASDLAGAAWLTFFGRPALVREGLVSSLSSRYRKSFALLAFLSLRPNRNVQRSVISELLWPDRNTADGRRNLRVVLNDLSGVLFALGLGGVLEVGRDWLVFRPGTMLYTDEMLLRALSVGTADSSKVAVFEPILRSMAKAQWFDIDGLDECTDWRVWLGSQRAMFSRLLRDGLFRPGQAHGGPSFTTADNPVRAGPAAVDMEWTHLALLRVGIDVASLSGSDERERHGNWQRLVVLLEQESRFFGGRLACVDDTGATFVFGETSLHAGYRWQALRAAIALASHISAPTAPHIGLSAGGVLVARGPSGVCDIRGLRVKLVEHIARAAVDNEIVVDDGFADFVPYFGLKPKEARRFRGFPRISRLFGRRVPEIRLTDLPPIWGMDNAFVGREPDLARMKILLREAQAGRGRNLVVEGRPGIGKTRIVWEFARQCLVQGARVQWFSGRAEIARQPWAALYEWLTRFADAHAGPVGERFDHMLSLRNIAFIGTERKVLLHFVQHRFVALADRMEFARAILRLIEEANLVVIDDAQWIDPASGQLLLKVFAKLERTLLVATRRAGESGYLPIPGAEIRHLGPLDDSAANRLIDNLAGPEGPDMKRRRACLAQARGVPLYLVAGIARRDADGPAGEVLTSMCNAVKPALEALGAAALLGLQWRLSDLSALVGPEVARAATECARQAHIVIGYDPDTWAFAHPMVCEEMMARLGAGERTRLAEAAAALFLKRAEQARAASLLEIAGKTEAARNAWLEGGRAAMELEDAEAACELFGHLERLGYPPGHDGLRARILHARACIVRDGYGNPAARQLCGKVMDLLPAFPGSEVDEIAFSAQCLLYSGSGGESKTVGLGYANALAATARNPVQNLAAEWAQGTTLFWLGRFSEARPYLEAVLAKAAKHPFEERTRYFPSDPRVFASIMYAWLLWFVGDPRWHEQIDEFVNEACASRLKQDACIALTFEAALRYSAGDAGRFSESALIAYNIASAEGFMLWEAIAGLLAAIAGTHSGYVPDPKSLHAAEEAIGFAYPAGINSARWLMAEVLVSAGMMGDALEVIQRALDDAGRCEHSYCLPDIWRLKAIAHGALRKDDEACEARNEAWKLAQAMGALGWQARWKESLEGRPC